MKAMKTKITLMAIAALMITACSEKEVSPDTPYMIEGELTGVRDSLLITLVRWENSLGETIDRDTIINGHFMFKGTSDEGLRQLTLSVYDEEFPSMSRVVYVAPGAHVKVKGSDTYIATWDVESSLDEQRVFDEIHFAAKDDMFAYQKTFIEYYKAMNVYHPEERAKGLADADRARKLNQQMDSILNIMETKRIGKMKLMKPSAAWLDELAQMARMVDKTPVYGKHKAEIKAMYNAIPDEMKQGEKAQLTHAYLNPPKRAKVGDDFPESDFYDLQGNLHHISEFKGKYILLDFWSRGCGPCIASFPKMKELYEEEDGRLAIISLNIDTDKHWRIASERLEITWNNWNELKGHAGLYANYNITSIPFYVLINPEGKIQEIMRGFSKQYIQEAMK